MHPEPTLAFSISDQYKDRCHELATQLSLPQCKNNTGINDIPPCSSFNYVLRYETSETFHLPVLALADTLGKLGGSLFVDFVSGKMGHRRRYGGGRGQPLAKAIGLKGGTNPTVVDATAGLGRDAFILASLGAKVTLIERSRILAALLSDGLERARSDPETAPVVSERMNLVIANTIEWLNNLPVEQYPDVIYLDPMYPHRDKSALVKKEMRYLREIVGDDADASLLLYTALSSARRRVVVKRPRTASILGGTILNNRKPDSKIESKNTRYDIYITSSGRNLS